MEPSINKIVGIGLRKTPDTSTRNCCISLSLVSEAKIRRHRSLNGVTVTVISERYVDIVNTFFIPDLQRRNIDCQFL